MFHALDRNPLNRPCVGQNTALIAHWLPWKFQLNILNTS